MRKRPTAQDSGLRTQGSGQPTLAEQRAAAEARIDSFTAELLDRVPDATVDQARKVAEFMDGIIHGRPSDLLPKGLMSLR